jgi:hypothetical protein
MTAVIEVADASGSLPRTGALKGKSKGDELKAAGKKRRGTQIAKTNNARKTVAKKEDGKKGGKGALQLAARKQTKKGKKLRLTER